MYQLNYQPFSLTYDLILINWVWKKFIVILSCSRVKLDASVTDENRYVEIITCLHDAQSPSWLYTNLYTSFLESPAVFLKFWPIICFIKFQVTFTSRMTLDNMKNFDWNSNFISVKNLIFWTKLLHIHVEEVENFCTKMCFLLLTFENGEEM